MFFTTRKILRGCNTLLKITRRYSSDDKKAVKVTLCGAAGSVGQPTSLLLKQCPYIDELAIYDVNGTSGLGLELANIDTRCKVKAHSTATVSDAFQNTNILVLTVGSSSKSSADVEKFFARNAQRVMEIMHQAVKFCPTALIAIATNYCEVMVPCAAEILKDAKVYDAGKLMGIPTLNVIRTNTFVAEVLGLKPECVIVPVVGGACQALAVPVLSQAKPCNDFTKEEIDMITKGLKTAELHLPVVNKGEGTTMSAAFAITRFVISLCKAHKGLSNVIECAFVRTDAHHDCKYLTVPVVLGPAGVEKHLGLPILSPYETCLLDNATPIIDEWYHEGRKLAGKQRPIPCDPCDPDYKDPCPVDWCAIQAKKDLSN